MKKQHQKNLETQKLLKLKKKYGSYSSWAIWHPDSKKGKYKLLEDTAIIEKYQKELNHKFVIIGLNMSEDISKRKSWSNFHGVQCRKLYKAFNKSEVRGAYMTDLIRHPESDSSKVLEYFGDKKNAKEIKKQILNFQEEMNNVGVTKNTTFILLGEVVKQYFTFFIDDKFLANKRICLNHYATPGLSDKKWLNETRNGLKK